MNNIEMEARLACLAKHLDRTDIIGYAAARNTRALEDELVEYRKMRDRLVLKHGEPDEGGATTTITPDSPNFAEFLRELSPIAAAEHHPDIFTLAPSAVIGELSGKEILEIDWMIEQA